MTTKSWRKLLSFDEIVSGSIGVLRITILLIVTIGMLSCSKSNSPTMPDFSIDGWETSFDAIMEVDVSGRQASVKLITATNPGTRSLIINDEVSALGTSAYSDEDSAWVSYFQLGYITSGSTVSFVLVYDGKTISGVLSIPSSVEGVFPFFGDSNYTFEWTTLYSPQLYLIDLDYYSHNELHTIREQIDGSALQHSIKSQLWGGGLVYPDRLVLQAINYKQISSGFIAIAKVTATHNFR
ncbi:MAG: hypothetical protein CVU48_03320 [Candidatus Cloacimonetes bacterium HGW-Cloacimonetes-1]|jgi:hypothetical protein|nr:MAG: hypothetical protein CVU48_03320 [Candidatus Cloacimonetes bacterium HGW-Cloacimonetes-1]